MKIRFAAAFYVACALALAAFAGAAFAGGNGQGGGDGHGNSAAHQESPSQQSASGDDNASGVKPSNTTGDKDLHGPGNSRPHKAGCGSHEVDVHALEHKSCGGETASAKQHEQKPAAHEQASPQKVTICHKTGSATNPYVEITVSANALKNGHTTAKGDLIPAPSAGCPAGKTEAVTKTEATKSAPVEQSCTATKTDSSEVLAVKHFVGPKGSGRFVVIHPNPHSAHFRNKHPDEVFTETVTRTVTVPVDCEQHAVQATTESSNSVSSVQAATATTTAATSQAPAAAPAASAAGGVLGAVAPLNTAAKAKPAASGGVLGTTTRLGRSVAASTLPFTGVPLWLFALAAASLIAVGALTRRAGIRR